MLRPRLAEVCREHDDDAHMAIALGCQADTQVQSASWSLYKSLYTTHLAEAVRALREH